MKELIRNKLKKLKPIHYGIIFLCLVLYIGAMVGVINYQQNKVATPPKLELIAPKDGETYTTQVVTVRGTTEPGATVRISGWEVEVASDGSFSLDAELKDDRNEIKVVAQKSGQKTTQSLTIEKNVDTPVLEPVEPGTVKKQAATATPTTSAANTPDTKTSQKNSQTQSLNDSGPETLWLMEAGILAAAGSAWQISRRKLSESIRH